MRFPVSGKIILQIAVILMLTIGSLQAADGIVKNSLKMYAGAGDKIGIKEVSSGLFPLKFCTPDQCLFDAHFAHRFYWLYCEIENESKTPYIFDSHFFYYDVTAYYFTDDFTFIDSVSSGNNVKMNKKVINTSSNALPVPIERRI
ncbi:MAG TPA: 7TM-DISM domain-containing protein, partial [Cytophagaceae bacterium]